MASSSSTRVSTLSSSSSSTPTDDDDYRHYAGAGPRSLPPRHPSRSSRRGRKTNFNSLSLNIVSLRIYVPPPPPPSLFCSEVLSRRSLLSLQPWEPDEFLKNEQSSVIEQVLLSELGARARSARVLLLKIDRPRSYFALGPSRAAL